MCLPGRLPRPRSRILTISASRRGSAPIGGGWQFVGPNIGMPCVVTGERHGFHGRASTASWKVESAGPSEVVLSWQGQGLALRRRVLVDSDGVYVDVAARALDAAVPLLVAEHIAFGVELLDPEVTVEL